MMSEEQGKIITRHEMRGIMIAHLSEENVKMCNLDIFVNHLKTAKEPY